MNDFELRAANLNLLPALEALLSTKSVTAAARRTHVSQSAMSHSLARLREVLGDPLLVPSGRDLVLSPRAARIAEALPSALDALERTLAPPRAFAPADTRRTFRVATLDYFEFVAVGDLLAHFRAHAPLAQLSIERFSPALVPALVAGEIDLALVGESSIAQRQGLARAELYRERFTVMLRRGHPALGPGKRGARAKLRLADYLAYPHVVVTIEGRLDGAVDRALERRGERRTVALRLPHFATAPLAVAQSDAICTIAESVALRAASLYPIELRAPPIEMPANGVQAVWSKRLEDDDAARWFRELFTSPRLESPHLRRAMAR